MSVCMSFQVLTQLGGCTNYGGLSLSDESFPNGGARGAFAKPSRRLLEAFSARDVFMKRS